ARAASAAARRAAATPAWHPTADHADPSRDRELDAGCGFQPARTVSRGSDLRSERRQLPRAAASSLYRLQSARARSRTRQGSIEETSDLSPYSAAGIRGVSDAAQDQAAAAP